MRNRLQTVNKAGEAIMKITIAMLNDYSKK